MNDAPTNMKPPKTRQLHGLSGLIKSRYKADTGQLDGRSALAQAMSAYKADLVSSLGGEGNLSAQELTVVEICAKDWLILQSIDSYILQAGTFNRRKKSCYSITTQRMQIADSLIRRLQALGLARRSKPCQTLNQLLQAPRPTSQVDPGSTNGLWCHYFSPNQPTEDS
jgi:hypothetical protein